MRVLALLLLTTAARASSDFRSALGALGLSYEGKTPWTLDGERKVDGLGRLAARAGSRRLIVSTEKAPDKDALRRLFAQTQTRFLARFYGNVGYPGMVTRVFEVPPDLRPRELAKRGPDAGAWTAPATADFKFGAGSADLLPNRAVVALSVCPSSATVVEVQVFDSSDAFKESEALAEADAFSCAGKEAYDAEREFAAARAAAERGAASEALAEADRALARVEKARGREDAQTLKAVGRHSYFARLAGRGDAAAADLARLRAVSPATREALVEISDLLRKDGEPQAALEAAKSAEALAPSDAAALSQVAEDEAALGRGDAAIAALERAAAAAPDDYWIEVRLAQLYRSQGRFEDAARLFERARTRGADRALSVPEGYARLFSGDFTGAQDAFKEVADSSATRPIGLHHLGAALGFAGRYAEALPKFEEARRLFRERGIKRGEDYAHTSNWIGQMNERLGRHEEAVVALRESVEAGPPRSTVWNAAVRGLFILSLDLSTGSAKRNELAAERAREECGKNCSVPAAAGLEADAAKAAALQGHDSSARRLRGKSLERLRNWTPADDGECASRACTLALLAELAELDGRADEARADYDFAVAESTCVKDSLLPALVLERRSGFLCRAGDYAGAASALDASAKLDRSLGDETGAERGESRARTLASAPDPILCPAFPRRDKR